MQPPYWADRSFGALELLVERAVAADARGRLCVLNPAALGGLRAWLDRIDRMWETQLSAFKRYAEAGGLFGHTDSLGGFDGDTKR